MSTFTTAASPIPAAAPSAPLEWRWKPFGALTPDEIYAILSARSDVFVVEQNCVYRDIDHADFDAWHLGAYDAQGRLACYLRVLLPDASEPDIRIGRVLTVRAFRAMGLGNAMLTVALERNGRIRRSACTRRRICRGSTVRSVSRRARMCTMRTALRTCGCACPRERRRAESTARSVRESRGVGARGPGAYRVMTVGGYSC